MKIKKQNTSAAPEATSVAGAAIASRLKLDLTGAGQPKTPMVNKTAVGVAFWFGLAALGVMLVLAYMMFRHWQFLMPA